MADVCCPDEPKPEPVKVRSPSFSQGRSKTTVVEVKRRRVLVPKD